MSFRTDVVIVGGGQAGLASSRWLSQIGLDHVVLERGRVAQRWHAERWNSLHLLTPNWMTRLPGYAYRGNDPNGFMHKDDVARFLSDYAGAISAPVMTHTRVTSISRSRGGFQVKTSKGTWNARAVIIATGACDRPCVPFCAGSIAPHVHQVTLDRYRSPGQINRGGVLVVGASASGIQIASELQEAGHSVTLAVGQHTRLPRRYRGRDIMVWLDEIGLLSRPRDPHADPDSRANRHSFQLIGGPKAASVDLMSFQSLGGAVTGRLSAAQGTRLVFGDTLQLDIARAEARQGKILAEIEDHIARSGIAAEPSQAIAPVQLPRFIPEMDLDKSGVKTIIWATGYRRDYSWLHIPVFTPGGEIVQQDGITACPGLYTIGLPGMRRRNSSFIDGVGDDARHISEQISKLLGLELPIAV